MTGYEPADVIGRNCRFLQGPETSRSSVSEMKQCLSSGSGWCGRLLNYRKDGTPFWNLLTVSPVKDDHGRVVKFVGMQVEVTKFTEGRQEESRRPNQLPVSLIRYDARQKEEAELGVAELVQAVKTPSSGGGGLETLLALPKVEGGESEKAREEREREETPLSKKNRRTSGFMALLGKGKEAPRGPVPPEVVMRDATEEEEEGGGGGGEGDRKLRRGMDLATTLERIQKNFVITDPRLPDNPIIFASDDFLELTEYSREEVLGRNCRFLQGKDTDPETVTKIRTAISNQEDVTVQLLNYTKSGKPFWNLFHLQAVRDSKGQLQYFIGVQLDASTYIEPSATQLPENTAKEGTVEVINTAKNIGFGLKELPDAATAKEDLWAIHAESASPRPHKLNDSNWEAILKIRAESGPLGLKHFRPIKPLGCGDTGSVHLVELRGTGLLFAMKAMDKDVMIARNKVHRACTERQILGDMDHPFLPTLYASFQTATHVCLITDFCAGGELYMALEKQKGKRFSEEVVRFFAAEILLALEYLHCRGVVYRDLKPENILIASNGHLLLTDFDLSFVSTSMPQLVQPTPAPTSTPRRRRLRGKVEAAPHPLFVAEPSGSSNSFVGTEEYIAPEIISGTGHSSPVDWWAFGIFIYEILYGRTPFRGRNRQRTFTNVLMKELAFPNSPPVSLEAKLLIKALLQRDPQQRLGASQGATAIKAHPWFANINWPLIRDMPVPPMEVPVKFISPEPDQARQASSNDEDLEWDDPELRSSSSLSTSIDM